MTAKLSRKEKRQTKTMGNGDSSFSLLRISPKTKNQSIAFDNYQKNKNLLLHGLPGTGKTFIAMYLALQSVLNHKTHQKVIIVRSAVPTRDIGFMPGSAADKMRQYETPYQSICSELFGRGDAYEILKQKGIVQFIPTSFIRGLTIDNAIMIVDESQNMDYGEIRSVITRVGENTRLIISGDKSQDDLTSIRFKEESGIEKMMDVLKKIESVKFIEFDENDIVRSDFIRQFILAEYGLLNEPARKTSAQIHNLPAFITG